MRTIQYVVFTALVMGMTLANAETMYRCGNTYSQQPCGPDAKEIGAPRKVPHVEKMPDMPAPPGVEMTAKAVCKAALIQLLKDPDSAKFGDIYRGVLDHVTEDKTGRLIAVRRYTARVNAKNGYGGYTGMKRYGCAFNHDESVLTWAGPSE